MDAWMDGWMDGWMNIYFINTDTISKNSKNRTVSTGQKGSKKLDRLSCRPSTFGSALRWFICDS